jgi:hypothetical protein
VAVTPEDIGLCGCWQVMAVERTSQDTTQPDAKPASDVGVYELERKHGRTEVDTLKSWCQRRTFSTVWPILQR